MCTILTNCCFMAMSEPAYWAKYLEWVHLSILCLSDCLSFCLTDCLSLFLSCFLPSCVCLIVFVSVCLFLCLSVCIWDNLLSCAGLSVWQSTCLNQVCPTVFISDIYPTLRASVCVCICERQRETLIKGSEWWTELVCRRWADLQQPPPPSLTSMSPSSFPLTSMPPVLLPPPGAQERPF